MGIFCDLKDDIEFRPLRPSKRIDLSNVLGRSTSSSRVATVIDLTSVWLLLKPEFFLREVNLPHFFINFVVATLYKVSFLERVDDDVEDLRIDAKLSRSDGHRTIRLDYIHAADSLSQTKCLPHESAASEVPETWGRRVNPR